MNSDGTGETQLTTSGVAKGAAKSAAVDWQPLRP